VQERKAGASREEVWGECALLSLVVRVENFFEILHANLYIFPHPRALIAAAAKEKVDRRSEPDRIADLNLTPCFINILQSYEI